MSFKRCCAFVKEDGSKRRKRCKRKTETSYCHQHRNTYQNINRICNGIFIGNKRAASDVKHLKKLGITHIVNCAGELKHITLKYDENKFNWIWLQMYDCEYSGNVTKHIEPAVKFIDDAVSNGHKVFVHCAAGISRSCSIVVAYLMYKHGKTYDDAYRDVKNMRPCCKPNNGFQRQLKEYNFSRLILNDNVMVGV
jgi:predicted protein tyrosine phosphatase